MASHQSVEENEPLIEKVTVEELNETNREHYPKRNLFLTLYTKLLSSIMLYRDLVGFWIIGMCNNFSYVVMFSAAFDIFCRSNMVIK